MPYTESMASFAELYERYLVEPLFGPWADVMLRRVQLVAGQRMLDVACGTGIVARLAQESLGQAVRIVGVDLNPQMLAVAREIAPAIDWRQGNAGALPVEAGEQFDVVVCQQGLQFFPDKLAAAREMRRVLAQDGRLAVATWSPLDQIPFLQELHRVAQWHLGPVVDRRHGFGDPTELERLLSGAGFHAVQVDTVSLTTRLSDPAAFVHLNALALVGMSPASSAMDEAKRAQVAASIAEDSALVMRTYLEDAELAFEIRALMATARG